MRKLQGLLRRVGSGDGDMEKVGTDMGALLGANDRETSASMSTSLSAGRATRSARAVRSKT